MSNAIIRKTLGVIFTGGQNLEEINKMAHYLKEKKS